MVRKSRCLVFCALFVLSSVGCYGHANRERLEVIDIPDRAYEVYVHSLSSTTYAVLLDIPDDEVRVAMRHTDRTERMGMDRPGPYIEAFRRRTRGFGSTLRITSKDGLERGYLMVSHTLSYVINSSEREIMVTIWDPLHDDRFGPKLGHPARRRPHGIY